MHWGHPFILLLLWSLPAIGLLLTAAHRWRREVAERFVQSPPLLRKLAPMEIPGRWWLRLVLLLTGFGLLICALARPRSGTYFESVPQRGVDVIVLLDVSKSMLAEDVRPNRLERAKADIVDLLRKLEGDRVGLIAFAGAAVVKVPLTTDHSFFQMVLNEIDTTSAPRGGSLIGDAIRTATAALQSQRDRDRAIVLITDGEDQDSFPDEAAKQAGESGIPIFAVGLGDPGDGARIPVQDAAGGKRYVRHDDQEVWSKMDAALLERIAVATSGAYIPAQTRVYDLGQIYEDHLSQLNAGELATERRKRFRERFQLFAVMGLLLLLLEMMIPIRSPNALHRSASTAVESRPSRSLPVTVVAHDASSSVATSNPDRTAASVAPSHERGAANRSVPTALLLLAIALTGAVPEPALRKVQEGVAHFRSEEFQAAADAFEAANDLVPDNERIAFDRGCVFDRLDDPDKAREFYSQAMRSSDPTVTAEAWFNLGCLVAANAKAAFGPNPIEATTQQREEGLKLLLEAIDDYRNSVRIDPSHANARYNLELLRIWIKQMQDLWQQRDRDKQRQDMDLLQFLKMIEDRQTALRTATGIFGDQPDSPQRRHAIRETQTAQRELIPEIAPLKDKIRATGQPPANPGQATGTGSPSASGPSPGIPPAAPDPDQQQAIQLLLQLADESGQAMLSAADHLDNQEIPPATDQQTNALELLHQITLAVAPFPNLVQRAVAEQASLTPPDDSTIDSESTADPKTPTHAGSQTPKNADNDTAPDATDGVAAASIDPNSTKRDDGDATIVDAAGSPASVSPSPARPTTDAEFERLVEQQSRIVNYSHMLTLKADAELKHSGATEANGETVSPADLDGTDSQHTEADAGVRASPDVAAETPTDESDNTDPAAQAAAQAEAMQQALRKAVEFGPLAQQAAELAVDQLVDHKIDAATPHQREALRLLREIADALPKQDNQQQDPQDDNPKDKNQKNDEQQDQQQENKDEQKNNEQQNDPPQEQQQPDPKQQQQQELSRQQAESVLRRAREREREHRELEKKIRQYLLAPGRVDRDW